MVKEEVKVKIKRVESGRERKTERAFSRRDFHLIAVRSGHKFGCATQIGCRSRRPLRETETLRFLANSNLTRRELRCALQHLRNPHGICCAQGLVPHNARFI